MHVLSFCEVAGLVPDGKLVELTPKSSEDLYSILCSQLSGISLLKTLKAQDTILVLFCVILFSPPCIFFVETPHSSGPFYLQKEGEE